MARTKQSARDEFFARENTLRAKAPPTKRKATTTAAAATAKARATPAKAKATTAKAKSAPAKGAPASSGKAKAKGWDWKLTGSWDIDCPYIRENYQDSDMSLNVHGEPDAGSGMSVGFDFGILEDAMRQTKGTTSARKGASQTVHFEWRGRETGEGEIQMGSGQHCTMTFTEKKGKGHVEGTFHGPYVGREGAAFTGEQISSSCSGSVPDFSHYNADQYEYERKARWR